MTDKKRLVIAIIIAVLAILFVVLNPKALGSFLESFNNAYNNANKPTNEEVVGEDVEVDDEFVVKVPDVKLEVANDQESGIVLRITPDIFKFVTPEESLEEGTWGGHMLVQLKSDFPAQTPDLVLGREYETYQEQVVLGTLPDGSYKIKVFLIDANNQIIAVEGGPGDFFYSLDFTVPLSQ